MKSEDEEDLSNSRDDRYASESTTARGRQNMGGDGLFDQ